MFDRGGTVRGWGSGVSPFTHLIDWGVVDLFFGGGEMDGDCDEDDDCDGDNDDGYQLVEF